MLNREELEPLGEGDDCVAYRRGSQVVRVPKHERAAAALRIEACVLGRIADALPLAVPRPVVRASEAGGVYALHEEIRGAVLTRAAWEALPAAAGDALAAELAGFLAALHSLPPERTRGCELPVLHPASIATDVLRDAATTLAPLLPPAEYAQLHAVLTKCAAASPDAARAASLIHRDIAPGHVLYDPETLRLTGVIDFGDLCLGDAARDFIYIYEDFGAALLRRVLAHYGLEPDADVMPRIRLWYLLEAAAWTAAMQRTGRDAQAREGAREVRRELAQRGATRSSR